MSTHYRVHHGEGFDVGALECREQPSGFGLFSVRDRLNAPGGDMMVHSSPGRGTIVHLEVPW